jgi:hypothetical protein
MTIDSTGVPEVVITGVTLGTGAPPAGTLGRPYGYAFTPTGDAGVTLATTSGKLPPGLSLSSTGVLSGRPTAPGAYRFAVTATGLSGASATRQETIVVSGPAFKLQTTRTTENGTITIVLRPYIAGTAVLTLSLPTASVAARLGPCRRGLVRVHGRCGRARTVVGVIRSTGRPGSTLRLRAPATRAERAALNMGRVLRVVGRLVYTPAAGGRPTVTVLTFTLKK